MTEKIKDWLLRTGASFEMAVARTMLTHRLGTQQSHYYVDPDDPTKSREVDVIASAGLGFDSNAILELIAVFECKYAPTPWVLYRPAPQYGATDPHFSRIASPFGEEWLLRASQWRRSARNRCGRESPVPATHSGPRIPDRKTRNPVPRTPRTLLTRRCTA
jgi:hypothetical protein